MIYSLVLAPLLLLAFMSMLTKTRYSSLNFLAFLFVIFLILIAGLRDGTGTDTNTYESIWSNIVSLNQALMLGYTGRDYLEPGFRYFMSFLKIFTESSIVFFFVMATITLGLLYVALIKIPKINIFLSIALYLMIFFMPYTLNAMRQAVAMSIFIFVMPYILNGDLKKTVFWSILAASIHIVGVLILLAYLVARIRIDLFRFVTIGLIFSILFYFLRIPERVIDFIAPGKFQHFSETWGEVSLIQVLPRFIILLVFVFAAAFILKVRWFSKIIMVYSIGFFIYIGFADASMMAARFNLFFRILEVVIFSVIVANANSLGIRFLFFFIASVFGGFIFYLNLLNEDNVYVSVF